jgi:uncharacterized membrane protein
MATTAEIMTGGILLLVNTFIIICMYFIGNTIMGPILHMISLFPIADQLKPSFWEITYIFPYIFGLLLIFEIIIIISFVYILARRQVTPYEY